MRHSSASAFLAFGLGALLLLAASPTWAGNECTGQVARTPCTDDGNACTDDYCDGAGVCTHPNHDFFTPCPDDANDCTSDHCNGAGVCIHPNLPFFSACASDANECTEDFCNDSGVCQHVNHPFFTPCNSDGNECTQDHCDFNGLCTHVAVPFFTPCNSDGNACTNDHCDFNGNCSHPFVEQFSPCGDDGNACTSDVCDTTGNCTHPGPATCGDTCAGTPDGTACTDDGNECTYDNCQGGICEHSFLPNQAPCDSDSNPCTRDACSGDGVCLHHVLGNQTPCPDDNNSCTRDLCDSGGTCQHLFLNNQTPCPDDGNSCTRDVCDSGGTCQHPVLSNQTPCADDGNECTRNVCDGGGTCHPGLIGNTAPCLDEGDACTFETCNIDSCLHTTLSGCVTPPQNKTQQKCILSVNKAMTGLAKAEAKISRGCVTAALKGKEPQPQTCLTADPKGKIEKARAKLADAEENLCVVGSEPDFGFAGASQAQNAVGEERLALVQALFGDDLTDALLPTTSSERSQCQAGLSKSAHSLYTARLKNFLKCKVKGLKVTIVSRLGLEQCLLAEDDDKLAKIVDKLQANAVDNCVAEDIDDLFPGSCSASASTSLLADCLEAASRCRACRTVARSDALIVDCDDFDDGMTNESCPALP